MNTGLSHDNRPNPTPRPRPSRSELMARAFDLGIEGYDRMTIDQLLTAIHRAEDALAAQTSEPNDHASRSGTPD